LKLVGPISLAFREIEAHRQELKIEDYSVSQVRCKHIFFICSANNYRFGSPNPS
jgi:hypothetical protein